MMAPPHCCGRTTAASMSQIRSSASRHGHRVGCQLQKIATYSESHMRSRFARRWTIDNGRCYGRLSSIVDRLIFVLFALAIAACGREAPPRAAASAPTLVSHYPTFAPAPTQAGAADLRTLGDPNAPITVIEY